MTRKPKSGTLSTSGKSDKNPKEPNVLEKLKQLLGDRKYRFHPHANQRMAERKIIFYEVLQALSSGRHDPKRDRYSHEHKSWEYSIEGKTIDERVLRIGIGFEVNERTGERLLIITVIEPGA